MSVWHSLDIVKFIQHSLVALKKFMTLTSALVAFKIHRNGQWLVWWRSCFQYQRSAVRFQSSANLYNEIFYSFKDKNQGKDTGNGPLKMTDCTCFSRILKTSTKEGWKCGVKNGLTSTWVDDDNNNSNKNIQWAGAWSSGYGRRLMWVRIPAPYTG